MNCPYRTLKEQNYSKFKGSVDIIRMADALDRFRLPKNQVVAKREILGLTVSADLKKVPLISS